MSDLQCPARILLAQEAPAGALAERLAHERVAATYDAPVDLQELADRHRGETVLVVGPLPPGHGHVEAEIVLVEVDADGRRVSPWEVVETEVRHT